MPRAQLCQARRERALRYHDAVELQHRVIGCVDEREWSCDSLFNGNAYELPRFEAQARRLDAQREERLGPVLVLDYPPLEPFAAHCILYGSSCKSCSSPPSITIAPWRRLFPVSENSNV